jgi:hypothetical protein
MFSMERIPWRLKLYAGRTRELSNSTWSAVIGPAFNAWFWSCRGAVLCTFSKIPAAAAAGIARSLQLSSSLAGQAVQYVMAGGTACPSQYSSSTPLPSPSAIGSAWRREGSILCGLRPLLVEPYPTGPCRLCVIYLVTVVLSTYDESVLKLSKVSFRGKCARKGHPVKLPSTTKLSRLLGHFFQLAQAARLRYPT